MSETPGAGRTLRADIADCRDIATRANANLLHAARLLPRDRQDFFFACYAAMRIIDDRVDDDFLCLPRVEREAGRPSMIAEISGWEAQCRGEEGEGPLPPSVRRALTVTALRSDLGTAPWQDLAGAMRRDTMEEEMADWPDFLSYADGATVAPATIFIYLLAADITADGFRYRLPEPAKHYASDLGIFCYLVHILRDLAKDADRSERLITIPENVLCTAGLERESLAAAIRGRHKGIPQLAEQLRARASLHRDAGRMALEAIVPSLGWREAKALRGLIAIYESLFETFSEDYFAGLNAASGLEPRLRREHLESRETS